MDPYSIIGAAGGFLNAAGSLFGFNDQQRKYQKAVRDTNIMNYHIWDESKAHNIDMFNRENQAAIDMWNMQNEYNDPSNQIKRLSAAGLNPSLALNSGNSAGVATSAPSVGSANPASAPTMQAPAVQAFDNAIARAAELSLSTLGSVAQAFNTNADTTGKRIANSFAPDVYKLGLDTGKENLELTRWNTNIRRLDYQFVKATQGDRIVTAKRQADILDSQRAAFRLDNQAKIICLTYLGAEKTLSLLESGSRIYSTYATVEQNERRLKYYYTQVLSGVALNNAQINKLNSDIEVNNAQIDSIDAQTDKTKAETAGVKKQNWIVEQTADSLTNAVIEENRARYETARYNKENFNWKNEHIDPAANYGREWLPFIPK